MRWLTGAWTTAQKCGLVKDPVKLRDREKWALRTLLGRAGRPMR